MEGDQEGSGDDGCFRAPYEPTSSRFNERRKRRVPVPAAAPVGEQIPFKKPYPPPAPRMQDEPEDLSLSADERRSRRNFWAVVEGKRKSGELVLACSSCLLVFSDALLYRMHISTHAWGRSFQCVACGTVCEDRVAFQRHLIGSSHG